MGHSTAQDDGQGRFPRHGAALDILAQRGRLRRLMPTAGADFSSNDYLGLAASPVLREAAQQALMRGVPVGAGGSRLLRGNHAEHQALEIEAAAFFAAETALYLGGGFQANQAIFSTLPMQGDLIVHDALIHASVHEGMRLSRAQTRSFAHNQVDDAVRVIDAWRAEGGQGRVWIAVESVYSMDGDLAPLQALATLAAQQDAVLVVDEAHATGVFGPQGQGLAYALPACPLVTLHTGGKGLGASGALICADRLLIDTLVNKARPFIYATAPSPLSAAILRASLRALHEMPVLQAGVQTRLAQAAVAAQPLGLAVNSPIVPVIFGDDNRALQTAQALREQGFDIRAIRPPTVPKGTARLRVSITGNVDGVQIAALFAAIAALQENRA